MTRFKLLVLDIDNTVFDWVGYYVHAFEALIDAVARVTGAKRSALFEEARAVFEEHGSIEYPFLIQSLPSVRLHYGDAVEKLLHESVEAGRTAFNDAAATHLKAYADVHATLLKIRGQFPTLPVVALTDAPRYVAMWKLNKLGILHDFSAVYGLPDPILPTANGKVLVDGEILVKHVSKSNFGFKGKIRILPEDYEKPGTRGLKTVLMDYEMDENPRVLHEVLWVGDNLRKDVGLGRKLGVTTVWAEYGTRIPEDLKKRLMAFSPLDKVKKNVALDPASHDTPKPEFTLRSFSELIGILHT